MDTIANRLGVTEPSLLAKAKEIEKLIDAKKSSTLETLSASLQCVISLQMAARMKGVDFDMDLAFKTSATKKPSYNRMLFTVEKLLHLEPVSSVKEMCLKLGISHVTKDAEKLINLFKSKDDSDASHPMYTAGAVWVVAKSQKVLIDKAKIIELARTTSSKLENVVEKLKKLHALSSSVSECPKGEKAPRTRKLEEIIFEDAKKMKTSEDSSCAKQQAEEKYDVWRKRMLKEAQEEMKKQFFIC